MLIGAPLHGVTGINIQTSFEDYLRVPAAGTESNPSILADILPDNSISIQQKGSLHTQGSSESQKANTEIPGGNWSTQGKLASVSCIYVIGTYAIDIRQGSHPRPWKRYGEGLARQTKSKHDNHEIQTPICKIRESLRIRKSLLIIAQIAFEIKIFESLEDQANWSCDHTLENWPSGGAGRSNQK